MSTIVHSFKIFQPWIKLCFRRGYSSSSERIPDIPVWVIRDLSFCCPVVLTQECFCVMMCLSFQSSDRSFRSLYLAWSHTLKTLSDWGTACFHVCHVLQGRGTPGSEWNAICLWRDNHSVIALSESQVFTCLCVLFCLSSSSFLESLVRMLLGVEMLQARTDFTSIYIIYTWRVHYSIAKLFPGISQIVGYLG